jgi:cytochrome oxidase Cu insertion factor (SCO1/SenC/PrrC family)
MRTFVAAVPCLAVLFITAMVTDAASVPRKAAELQIQMTGAKPIELSQYRGRPVVLAFILTTCSHCQYTTGLLVKLQTEFVSKGLQVIECAVNDGAAADLPNFIKRFQTNFPVGYSADTVGVLSFMQHPQNAIPHMPMLAFIDRHGIIREQYQGIDALLSDEATQEENLRAEILKLIAIR